MQKRARLPVAQPKKAKAKKHNPYGLYAPCETCPFLKKGGVRLRLARVREITGSMLQTMGGAANSGEFTCHKTTVGHPTEDDRMVPGPKAMHCAGALIFAEKQGKATQMMRVCERIGMYDPRKLKGHDKVFDSVQDMVKTAIDYKKGDEEGEPCSVCGPNCEAPAGWLQGGDVVENTDTFAEYTCARCGNPVCGPCSKEEADGRVCDECSEEA